MPRKKEWLDVFVWEQKTYVVDKVWTRYVWIRSHSSDIIDCLITFLGGLLFAPIHLYVCLFEFYCHGVIH